MNISKYVCLSIIALAFALAGLALVLPNTWLFTVSIVMTVGIIVYLAVRWYLQKVVGREQHYRHLWDDSESDAKQLDESELTIIERWAFGDGVSFILSDMRKERVPLTVYQNHSNYPQVVTALKGDLVAMKFVGLKRPKSCWKAGVPDSAYFLRFRVSQESLTHPKSTEII